MKSFLTPATPDLSELCIEAGLIYENIHYFMFAFSCTRKIQETEVYEEKAKK